MQGAREFLSKVLPWEQTGDGIYFNIHWRAPWSNQPPGQKNHFWDGRACSSLTDMVKQLSYLNKFPDRDFYICMSSQSRCEVKTSRKGNSYKRAVRFRDNVVALKSFYIDVDVKLESYQTQGDALHAFKLFVDAVDLPVPTIVVGSGSGGFHAHWVVDRVLDLATWQPVANALANACQSVGLICDTQCTIDSARILRIPGTLNHKHTPPKDVTLISNGAIVSFEDFKEVLEPFNVFTPAPTTELVQFPFPRRQPTIEGSELSAGIVVYDAPQPSLGDVAEACPFIEDAWVEGGENYNNPLWFMTLQVAAHLDDGRAAAHKMSCGHRDYRPEDTDEQYDRIVREHQARDIGWPQCSKIKSSGATQCATCPHLSSGKSPFNFVSLPAPVLSTAITGTNSMFVDTWPPKYTRGADGLIYFQDVNEAGVIVDRKVCPYQISSGWLQDDPWKLHFTALTSIGKAAKLEIPLADFGAMGGTRKALSTYGLVLSDKDFKATQEFLLAWTQKLQQQKNSVVSSTAFGWTNKEGGGIEGFVYAGRVWGDGMDRPAAISDFNLAKKYTPTGNSKHWLEACKLVTAQQRPGLQYIVAAAFASPLMQFTGYEGSLLSTFSGGTGIGKTSALKVGLAVWGHPQLNKHGLKDTGNSLFNELGKTQCLPAYWDEILGQEEAKKFVNNIFDLSGGVEKSRMKRDGSLAARGTWNTIMISAANLSLYEAVTEASKTHNAGLARMFEIEIAAADANTPGQIARAFYARKIKELDDNFGHAGLMYAQFLGGHVDRVKAELKDLQDKLEKEFNQQDVDRLWIATIAAVLTGARFANELGLTDFNLALMRDFSKVSLDRMRKLVSESPSDMANKRSVVNILQQFLNAMRSRNTIHTNRIHGGQGKPTKGAIVVLNDTSKLDALFVQIGRDDGLLRISSTQLTKWLSEMNKPRSEFINALTKELGFKKGYGIIGSGTTLTTGIKEHFLEISMIGNKKLEEFIEPPT